MLTKQSGGINLTTILMGLVAAYVASPVDLLPGPLDDGALIMIALPALMLLFAINSIRKGGTE